MTDMTPTRLAQDVFFAKMDLRRRGGSAPVRTYLEQTVQAMIEQGIATVDGGTLTITARHATYETLIRVR